MNVVHEICRAQMMWFDRNNLIVIQNLIHLTNSYNSII